MTIEKKSRRTLLLFKKTCLNKDNIKEKYLLINLSSPMLLNRRLLLTQHDQWLVKNSWKTLQTFYCERYSCIKRLHFEKLLKFYSEIKIMKRISVTWDCNALSITDIFFGCITKFRTWELFTKTFHACFTLFTHRHLRSCFQ